MKINMKNPVGMIKQVKLGFSWTMLFFGIFVPLLRGDWKWFVFSFLLACITFGISWVVLPFIYNKIYIKGLLEKGWLPADEMSVNALKSKGVFIPNMEA